ncbi:MULTISPECIES: hypothetical protein [unclassified Amycolatopsis]|uniref:hypothetical protein n=1 Tax=unclassified Amycolatopsis TaxID=2618356 RepID=UPI00287598D4|nr:MULTISPECIES: hypothetical protein [unclassified Amycolatopsis]MDS0139938.1 hypothetical protein [Amycolatopsis sp. 505]MDS0148150.1 hypothetical protein [Amycolatopsis sp. CM201R]
MSAQVLMVLGSLALVGVFAVWRSGRKSAIRAQRGVREITRMTGNTIRLVLATAIITFVQWLVIVKIQNTTATWIALVVPALLSAATIVRLMAITEIVHTTRGGRR